jgi:hypothetical protein
LHGLSAAGGDLLTWRDGYSTFPSLRSKDLVPFRYDAPNTLARARTRSYPAHAHARSHHAREWLLQRFLFLSALQRPCTVQETKTTQGTPPSPRWGGGDTRNAPLPAAGRGKRGPRGEVKFAMDGWHPTCLRPLASTFGVGRLLARVGRACCGSFG